MELSRLFFLSFDGLCSGHAAILVEMVNRYARKESATHCGQYLRTSLANIEGLILQSSLLIDTAYYTCLT